MRRSLRTAPLIATLFATSLGFAQSPAPVSQLSTQSVQRFHDIANLIVRQANLRAGQAIVISGSPDYLPVDGRSGYPGDASRRGDDHQPADRSPRSRAANPPLDVTATTPRRSWRKT